MSQALHNNAMHRMPNPPLRCGYVTGDGGRYWPGIREFLAGGVQRPLHRDWLQARSLW